MSTTCWRASRTTCSISAPISAPSKAKAGEQALRIVPAQVERLEREIDAMNGELAPAHLLHPARRQRGGGLAASRAHRGAPRRALHDAACAPSRPVNPEAIKYINRLSDHLFVLARKLNDNGGADVLWVPGANR